MCQLRDCDSESLGQCCQGKSRRSRQRWSSASLYLMAAPFMLQCNPELDLQSDGKRGGTAWHRPCHWALDSTTARVQLRVKGDVRMDEGERRGERREGGMSATSDMTSSLSLFQAAHHV